MLGHRVDAFRLICSGIICVLIGIPVGGCSVLQTLMTQRHIYENRCTVSYAIAGAASTADAIICAESRAAYVNLYTSSGVGYAMAMLPAYFALKYVGYLFSSTCCALLLAAGSVVITDPTQDRWGHDKYALGVFLLASAAPFALLNNLSAIATSVKSQRGILVCLALLMAGTQLGPLLLPAIAWSSDSLSTIDNLFQVYLWVPCGTLFTVLLLMPFPDIVPKHKDSLDLLNAARKYISPAAKDTVSENELVPLLAQSCPEGIPLQPSVFQVKIPFKLVLVTLLSLLSHALPIDLMIVSGQARSEPEIDVTSALNLFSPLLAAAAVPPLLTVSRHVTLNTLYLFTAFMCTLNLGLQLLAYPAALQIAAALAGSCRLLLAWFLIACSIRCLGVRAYFLLSSIFLIGSCISWFALPIVDQSFVFKVDISGHNGYKLAFALQAVSLWFTTKFLRDKKHIARRYALDEEARLAFLDGTA